MSRLLARGDRPHPLDPLSPAEIEAVRGILAAEGLFAERVHVAYLGLDEPAKGDVLAGAEVPRRARAFLLDLRDGTNTGYDVRVCLTTGRVVGREPVDPGDGQVPLLDREHDLVRRVLREDGAWRDALARRDVDPDAVFTAALSAGHYDLPGEAGQRIARVLAHLRPTEDSLPWAHPIDGLVAFVDLVNEKVLQVIDTGAQPVPDEPGDYHLATGFRTTQKPIHITQPDGPSFTVDGTVVGWEKWRVRLGYDMREGLVLHQLGFDGRPVVYRASVAEMVVPYGDPSPVRFWQNYFDTGEYQLGKLVNGLELGCDCVGDITYFDVTVTGDDGRPVTKPNAICMHEEDAGVLWKHTDPTGPRDTRRQRRLVISFFVTVGNYDYGFYWYLYLDGTIELEVKATGIVFTAVYDDRAAPYASQVAPGLAAPYHQHLFGARLDMTVGGPVNAVDEVEVAPLGGPWATAFGRRATRLRTERAAIRDADMPRDRTWHVVNPEVTNRFGDPVGYALYPEGKPTLLAQEGSSIRRRAGFATRHLWVTRYDPAERYPAGDFVGQHPGGAGLPAYAAADRDIDGADIVLWHTFGLTHFPRPEDWPVMPVDTCGFVLKPVGFCDRNPTLDVPPPPSSCH